MPEPAKVASEPVKLPPPSGDSQRAEKYVIELIQLLSSGKLIVEHTDLSRFDPSSLHDHYRIDMQDYQIEVSHSKQALTGKDSYVMLFNNLQEIEKGCTQKVILAYLILTSDQFKRLQDVCDEQIETRKKIEESKRFDQAITGVDLMLDKISKGEVDLKKTAQPLPEIRPEKPEAEHISEPEKAAEPVSQQTNKPPEPPAPTQAAPIEQPAAQPNPNLEGYNIGTPQPVPQPPANPVPIEDVQQILHQAAESGAAPAQTPSESIPTIGNLPASAPPAQVNNSGNIDQAIDQAFKPADNAVLDKPPVPGT